MTQELKRPLELAGLKARLERARMLETKIGETGKRYDSVLNAIEEKHGQAEAHVGYLEHYDVELGDMIRRMIGEGSNNPPEGEGNG